MITIREKRDYLPVIQQAMTWRYGKPVTVERVGHYFRVRPGTDFRLNDVPMCFRAHDCISIKRKELR